MSMGIDFDVNFPQIYPDSIKDVLKQTMITQDTMFRNQVNELHRLYTTQRSLMKDIGCQEFSPNISGRFAGSRFHHRPLNIQSSAVEYINYNGEEISKKRNDLTDHFPEKVNLSLSIGSVSTSKNIASKSWNKRVIFSQDIVDLKESRETTSNEDPKSVLVDSEESAETEKMVKLLTSNKKMQFDLNKSQHDDSFFQSTRPLEGNSSLGSSTGDFSTLFGGSCSTHTSLDEPDNINTACSVNFESVSGPQLELSDGPHSDGRNFDLSQLVKTPCQDDIVGSSEESEIQHLCFDHKKCEITEVDYTTQRAALSLLSISIQETSTTHQDCILKSSSNRIEVKETEVKVRVKPQCSLDSYESLVLNLKESNVEDECVSSKPFDLDEMDKKESGVKLRRGRRLKDFQKDILPNLSTLSRHEIWEDIKVMQGVIRSREYKKLQAQAAKTENWFSPVRSKRSRLNYVGRKCYT